MSEPVDRRENEVVDSVPDSWCRVRLSDICDVNPTTNFNSLDNDDLVTFLPMAAVQELSGRIDLSQARPVAELKSGYTKFKEADVLFAKITPSMENGKVAVVRGLLNGTGGGSTEFHVLRSCDGISPDLIFYFLIQDGFRQEARRNMKGTAGQLRVPPTFLANARISCPPSAEQARIVAKLDELFSEIEKGEENLRRARALVKRYRQSVLKAAVTGDLTRDWRDRNAGKGETGADLLQHILKTRREAWEAAELEKMKAKGKPPRDDRWKQKYKEPESPDTNDLPAVPEGWVWVSMAELICETPKNGISVKGTDEPPGTPAIRLDALTDTGLDLSRRRYLDIPKNKVRKLSIRPNDFLVSRANGSKRLMARAVLVNNVPEEVVFPDTMIRFRFAVGDITRKWISVIWGARLSRDQLEGRAKTSAGIWKVSQSDILKTVLPLPCISEQEELVARTEDCFSIAASVEQDIEDNERKIKSLRQSVLRTAFSGDLVSQAPNDEPASVLVERIAAERAATNGAKPQRGRPRKAAGA